MIRSRDEYVFKGKHQYELMSTCVFMISTDMLRKNRFESIKKIYSIHSICNQGEDYRNEKVHASRNKSTADIKLVINNVVYTGNSILEIEDDQLTGTSRMVLTVSKALGVSYPKQNRLSNASKLIAITEKLICKEIEALNLGKTINSIELLAAVQALKGMPTTRKFGIIRNLTKSADRILKEK